MTRPPWQPGKFEEAARALGCDEDEAGWMGGCGG
jgi:hypothetical protein